jgi:hypothetical protein
MSGGFWNTRKSEAKEIGGAGGGAGLPRQALPAAAREANPAKRSAAVIPQHDTGAAAFRKRRSGYC